MIKKISFLISITVLISGWFMSAARAQDSVPAPEAILSYVSAITVNTDNSVDVVETIAYRTGPQERHGIYRDIYPYSSQNRKMTIDRVAVTDDQAQAYQFRILEVNGNIRIKIGDPNQTFTGQKIYVIRYRAANAIAQLKEVDEIYWNVTGNEWGVPIYRAQAAVVLPLSATLTQSACYYGPKNSTDQCPSASSSKEGVYAFMAPGALAPHAGLTIAVGFSKGIVTPYLLATENASNLSADNTSANIWRWPIAAILPILTFIFSLSNWYKKGRDPKGTGIIVPQYDVPDGLSPLEVGGIANELVGVKGISAEIIYLATKGYLKIQQLEESFIGLIKSTDYELIKLKDWSDITNNFDQKLLMGLFKSSHETVKLSALKNVFYKTTPGITTAVLDALLKKGYYKNLGRMKYGDIGLGQIIFLIFWGIMFVGIISQFFVLTGNAANSITIGIFWSIIIFGIFYYFSPAKTAKGVAAKEYILGLKNYLQIAEKDRLLFHNAPEKKPAVFEKLLPFAMVLGVADIWAKEFEDIYTVPPAWYSGSTGTMFNVVAFSHSLNHFSSLAAASMAAPSSRGGSGGGGSSGGGGGGGGGGGW